MRFVIYAPNYDENSGGAIVLHKLCSVLNENGYTASLWQANRPRNQWLSLGQYLRVLAFYGSRAYRPKFVLKKGSNCTMARNKDLRDAIVVYAETVEGNPLNAKRYVRWLLNKPDFFLGKSVCQDGELYFSYNSAFNTGCHNMIYGGALTVFDVFRDVYVKTNYGERRDVCYMVRKGIKRSDLPNIPEHLLIDGLSHSELSKIFNEYKFCYFYDLYTMYVRFAALCGCIPVIVPLLGVTREHWMHEEYERYGLAYGDEDIDFAVNTRDLLIEKLDEVERQNRLSVDFFVGAVNRHFSID